MTEVPPPDEFEDPSYPQADEPVDNVPFDPTGLDLARQMAAAAGNYVPMAPPRTPRKKREGRSASDRGGKDEPSPLGEVMEGVIAARGWSTQVNVHLLMGRWPELVGPAVAEHSTPEAYRDKVLVVRTSSTSWASQLRLMAPQLVARMNESLGQGTVTRVQVLGPEAPSWRHGPRTVKGRGPRDTYG